MVQTSFCNHFCSLRSVSLLWKENQSDVPVVGKVTSLTTKDYRKPTHSGWYFSFKSSHPLLAKRDIIQGHLHNRTDICQEWQHLCLNIDNMRCGLQLICYPQGFFNSFINAKCSTFVVLWSEFLATDPEVWVRLPALPEFLEWGPLSLVNTIEELLGRKSSDSSLENREYGHRDPLCWPYNTPYPQNVDTNFADKRRLLSRYIY
jgi:hypothetical protein